MAEWKVSKKDRRVFDKLLSESKLPSKDCTQLKNIVKKDIITYEDLTNIKKKIPNHIPVFIFFNKLELNYEDNNYKASEEFRKKTEKLRIQQEQESYKKLVKSVDPAQKYGRIDHMENFGAELKTVNRQMISVINVLITVVGAFFFGFSGVTYAYPHLKLDLATRFIIGLVPATIVFFADLYFVVKSMDTEEDYKEFPNTTQPVGEKFSFKNMESKKND